MAGIFSKEAENYIRLTFLVRYEGTKALRTVLEVCSTRKYSKPSFDKVLQEHCVITQVTNLYGKGKPLTKGQWFILYGRHFPHVNFHKLGKPETFDITLAFLLVRNICGLLPPRVPPGSSPGTLPSWDYKPDPNDTSFEANLARIKYYRNVLAHHETGDISDHDFNDIFESLKQSILDISASLSLPPPQWSVTSAELERFRTDSVSPDDEKEAEQIRKDWEQEETDIVEKLNQVVESLNETRIEMLEIKRCVQLDVIERPLEKKPKYRTIKTNPIKMKKTKGKIKTRQGKSLKTNLLVPVQKQEQERGPGDIKTTEESVKSTMIEQAAIYFRQNLEPMWETLFYVDDTDAIAAAEKIITQIQNAYVNTKEIFLKNDSNAEKELKAKMQKIVNDKVNKMELSMHLKQAGLHLFTVAGFLGVMVTGSTNVCVFAGGTLCVLISNIWHWKNWYKARDRVSLCYEYSENNKNSERIPHLESVHCQE